MSSETRVGRTRPGTFIESKQPLKKINDQMMSFSRQFVLWTVVALLTSAMLLPAPAASAATNRSDHATVTNSGVFVLELIDPPAAAIYASAVTASSADSMQAAAASQAQLATVEQAQQAVLQELNRMGLPVVYRTQRVYNGIAVIATADDMDLLRALPGVAGVHRAIGKTPANTNSVPHVGAPQVWEGTDVIGPKGEGIRIAVIDTGVDYLHTDFGGPGVGYAQNDRTVAGDVPGYPSVKVVGGYDFVGDTYNADPRSVLYQPLPQPDPDPMDCYGHGTHVAGTAAGFGVQADGSTYRGTYDSSTDIPALRIGPGIAPLAEIYALKVFGCTGSSDLTDVAIEWAIDPNRDGDFSDRVDVINLSLGSPYGSPYDTTAVAASNAAALGVIVVASAGNAGDQYMVVGSPSTGDRVISVAATQQTLVPSGSSTQMLDQVADFSARGPRRGDALLKPEVAAPGASIYSAAAGTGASRRSMSGTSMASPHVAGAMALLRELHPDWSVEELKALVMNTAAPLVFSSSLFTSTTQSPARIGAGQIDLAAAAVADVIAMDDDNSGAVSLSFGAPTILRHYEAIETVRITSRREEPETFRLSYYPIQDVPGVDVTLPITALEIPASGYGVVPVRLEADVDRMRQPPITLAANVAADRPYIVGGDGVLALLAGKPGI